MSTECGVQQLFHLCDDLLGRIGGEGCMELDNVPRQELYRFVARMTSNKVASEDGEDLVPRDQDQLRPRFLFVIQLSGIREVECVIEKDRLQPVEKLSGRVLVEERCRRPRRRHPPFYQSVLSPLGHPSTHS